VVTPQYSNGLGNFARRSASCPVRPERHPHTASVPVSTPAPTRHTSPALRGLSRSPRVSLPPFAIAAPCNLVQCRLWKRRTFPPPSLTYPIVYRANQLNATVIISGVYVNYVVRSPLCKIGVAIFCT
jgi:hypothetical protein